MMVGPLVAVVGLLGIGAGVAESGPAPWGDAVAAAGAGMGRGPDTAVVALGRRVPELIRQAEIPGLSVAVVRDGRLVWTGGFGSASVDDPAPVTGRTVFQAASLSKPVLAYIVLRLVERGVLGLDQPLCTYLPNARMAHDERYRRITARMVLAHASGLPNWGGDTLALAFDPGTSFRYSGEGYVYLQRVVEEITGFDLEELARREVFEPLGMDRSSFVWRPRFADDVAQGHDAIGRATPLRTGGEANAAASLLTTAEDYGRFVTAVLSGRGLAPESRRLMLRAASEAGASDWSEAPDPRIRWGLGWGVQDGDRAATIWHWGDNGVYKAFVAADPARGTAVVYFANGVHGLAVAEDLVRLGIGVRHGALRWLEHEQYDHPRRIARRGLYHTFVERGTAAGLSSLREIRGFASDLWDVELATGVAGLLGSAGRTEAALAVLELARADFDDPEALEALGRTYLEAGRREEAAAVFRGLARSADDPGAVESFRRRAEWIEARVRAARDPVDLDPARLRDLAGDYGPRHITLDDGSLYYQRDGNPRYRLVAVAPSLFQPEGLETFRIRFVPGPDGLPVAIEGRYFDGSTDLSPRDGS